MQLKIVPVGNSAGVILPRELMARLRVAKGDTLFVTETPDGIKLMPNDPAFAERMAVAEEIMRRERDVLKRLAQS